MRITVKDRPGEDFAVMRISAEATRLFGEAVSLKLAADGHWENALCQALASDAT